MTMTQPILRANPVNRPLLYQKAINFFMSLEEGNRSFESLSREEIKQYQKEQISAVCHYAIAHNSFYRQTLGLLNSEIDLSTLKCLDKETIRGDTSLIKCCEDKYLGQIHLTSGTTGEPTYIAYTLADQYIYDLLPQYPNLFPFDENDTVGIALPYEFALPALAFQRLFQFVFGSTCISLGKGGYMAPIDKTLSAMSVYKPSVIATTPSYAALLYEEAIKQGYSVEDFGIKTLILLGEGCSYTYRNRLQEMWKAKAYFFYGSTEIGLIGKECEKQNGYHICEGHVFVEVVDEKNKPLPYGEIGELVVTTLLREGMPMIRYKTEDKGYIAEAPCECGSPMKKLVLLGRERDQLTLGENEISPFVVENVLLKCSKISLWYQLHLNNGHLIIHCENTDNDDESNGKIVAEVKELIKEFFEIDCEVLIRDDIPRKLGKNQRVFLGEDIKC